jgi:hypothetical protein
VLLYASAVWATPHETERHGSLAMALLALNAIVSGPILILGQKLKNAK